MEPWTLANDASSGVGFSKLLLDLLPYLNTYGAVITFRCLRDTLWPMGFPVYASVMLFPHPSVCVTSGFMLFTRCLPRIFDELANMTATLGSFYWLGFETSGLSPDKKRLALLGAQQLISSVADDIVQAKNDKMICRHSNNHSLLMHCENC